MTFEEEFHRRYGAVLTRLVTKLTLAQDHLQRAKDQLEAFYEDSQGSNYIEQQVNGAVTDLERALWTCRELPNGDNLVRTIHQAVLGIPAEQSVPK